MFFTFDPATHHLIYLFLFGGRKKAAQHPENVLLDHSLGTLACKSITTEFHARTALAWAFNMPNTRSYALTHAAQAVSDGVRVSMLRSFLRSTMKSKHYHGTELLPFLVLFSGRITARMKKRLKSSSVDDLKNLSMNYTMMATVPSHILIYTFGEQNWFLRSVASQKPPSLLPKLIPSSLLPYLI